MLEDDDIMPFGKHAGSKMIDVPDEYLIWLYNQCKGKANNEIDPITHKVIMYIEDSFDEKQLKK